MSSRPSDSVSAELPQPHKLANLSLVLDVLSRRLSHLFEDFLTEGRCLLLNYIEKMLELCDLFLLLLEIFADSGGTIAFTIRSNSSQSNGTDRRTKFFGGKNSGGLPPSEGRSTS